MARIRYCGKQYSEINRKKNYDEIGKTSEKKSNFPIGANRNDHKQKKANHTYINSKIFSIKILKKKNKPKPFLFQILQHQTKTIRHHSRVLAHRSNASSPTKARGAS